MLDCVPGRRIDDVVVVDPSDIEHPVGFNPFYRVRGDERALVAANITATFKHIWRDSWGPRLEYILYNTVAALLDAPDELRPTFLSIPRSSWSFPPASPLRPSVIPVQLLAQRYVLPLDISCSWGAPTAPLCVKLSLGTKLAQDRQDVFCRKPSTVELYK